MARDAETFFGEAGFEHWSTGGGGVAVAARIGNAYVLITDEDGMGLPVNGAPILVGIYSDTLGEGIEHATVATFEAAIDKANELIAKHVAED